MIISNRILRTALIGVRSPYGASDALFHMAFRVLMNFGPHRTIMWPIDDREPVSDVFRDVHAQEALNRVLRYEFGA